MQKHIPNIITLGNLFLGCCALVAINQAEFDIAVYCLLGSFLCDYADGMIARALHVSSPVGKELDSLADVVSFGVVPGMFLFVILTRLQNHENGLLGHIILQGAFGQSALAFVLSCCAALRLAKFNLDTRQTTYFLGLSTPATTIFVIGICMTIIKQEPAAALLNHVWVIYGIIAILCYLMLSEIKLLGLKINPTSFKANTGPIVGLLTAIALIYAFHYTGAALAILLYIVASVVYFQTNK